MTKVAGLSSAARWGLSISAGLVLLLGVLFAGYCHYERYKRFAVHEPGKVYRCSWLEPEVVGELVKTYGIRTVINLCDEGEKIEKRVDAERAAVEQAGGKLVEIVYPANNTWHPDDPTFDETEKLLADPATYPIMVHCYHGKERTVKCLAIYDIHFRGMTAQESLGRMPVWGEHPWPIITFAFNYETRERQRAAEAARQQPETQRK